MCALVQIYVAPERNIGDERAQKTREKREVETALGQFEVKTKVLPSKTIKDNVAGMPQSRTSNLARWSLCRTKARFQ